MNESGSRFEVKAAWVMGIGLPLLEAMRRRTNFHPIPSYVDDFIAGALLLVAARAVQKKQANAELWLAGAWGILCGGLYGSFFSQLIEWQKVDVSGHSGLFVVVIKGVLFAITLAAFTMTLRRRGNTIAS